MSRGSGAGTGGGGWSGAWRKMGSGGYVEVAW